MRFSGPSCLALAQPVGLASVDVSLVAVSQANTRSAPSEASLVEMVRGVRV